MIGMSATTRSNLAVRTAILCATHAWPTVILVLVLTVGSAIFAANHFNMNTDTLALIDGSEPWRKDEAALNRAFPQNGEVIVVVIDGETPELAETAAATLSTAMAHDPAHFSNVRRPDGGQFFARNGLLYRSVGEVRRTTEAMVRAQPFLGPLAADTSLHGIARAVELMAIGIERGDARFADVGAPLTAIESALRASAVGENPQFSWTRLFAGDGPLPPTRRLIIAVPKLDYSALMPGEAASDTIRSNAEGLGFTADRGVRVRLTGPVPLADEEFKSLEHNIGAVAGIMSVAMFGTLWLALRSGRMVALVLLSTITGLVVTTALGLAVVGRFTLISVAFIPLFVGIGVDFAIQFSTRFLEERLTAPTQSQAVQAAATGLGRSLLLAAAAVSLGFCAFLPTAYVGLSELGIIAGLGMLVAIGLTLSFLPALLALLPVRRPSRTFGSDTGGTLDLLLVTNRNGVLAAFALSMVLSIATLPLVRFDFNPLNLRSPASESRATLADLERDPDRTPTVAEILAASPEQAEMLAARLRAAPEVRQVLTLRNFVPPDQAEKLALIGDAALLLDTTLNPFDTLPPPTDADTRTALREAAGALARALAQDRSPGAGSAEPLARQLLGLADGPPAIRQRASEVLVPPLAATLDSLRSAILAEPVSLATLPEELKADWQTSDGESRVVVYPAGDIADNANISRFTAAVQRIAPHATGAPITIQEAASTIAGAFVRAGVIAVVIISLLLFAVLKSVREVLFTITPVVLSGFLTLATCVVFDQPINFANIIAFPLLFGVGVAFHIYFVMAWSDGVGGLLQTSLARAVFFSAMATGTAFGSLIFSSHPGTASMGLLLAISLIWTLVCALIFEPALLGPPKSTGTTSPTAP